MLLKDKYSEVRITMKMWDYCEWSPDFSNDFFNAGTLPTETDDDGDICYIVPDVLYCIEQAQDWENNRGDYADDEEDPNNKAVTVRDCLLPFSELNYG